MADEKLSDNVVIDNEGDVIEIHGIHYSGSMFRGLGFEIREDQYFQIIKRDDGVLSVHVTQKPPF